MLSGLLAVLVAFESFVICSHHLADDSSFFNLRVTTHAWETIVVKMDIS